MEVLKSGAEPGKQVIPKFDNNQRGHYAFVFDGSGRPLVTTITWREYG